MVSRRGSARRRRGRRQRFARVARPVDRGRAQRASRLTDFGTLRTIAHNTIEHGLSSAASAMAFDIFLGIMPLLALMGAIAGSLARSGKNVGFDLSFLDVAPGPAASSRASHLSRFETGTSFAPLVIMGFLWLSSSARRTSRWRPSEHPGAARPARFAHAVDRAPAHFRQG